MLTRITVGFLFAGIGICFSTQPSRAAVAVWPSAESYQAPNLRWVSTLRSWNYDFFGTDTDADGHPVDTTDGPVNIVFVGAASPSRIRQALRPILGCRTGTCAHDMQMAFRHPGTGGLYWVGDGGVKTASSFRCPFPGGGPADYHLRLYQGPNVPGWGHLVLGTAHMDCERARRFGWHERAERFVTAVLRGAFPVSPSALNLSNAWAASSSRGCERGQWRYFGRPAWHCMESDGRATVVYVPRQTIDH